MLFVNENRSHLVKMFICSLSWSFLGKEQQVDVLQNQVHLLVCLSQIDIIS